MEIYCVSCKKNTENENSSFRKTKQNGLMLSSNCVVFYNEKPRFIKEQEARDL